MTVKQFETPEQKEHRERHGRMVEWLEELAARARDGEILGCAVAWVDDRGFPCNGFKGQLTATLGHSISVLDHRFKTESCELMEDEE